MKKKIFLVLFLVLTLSLTDVHASDEPDHSGIEVEVSSTECSNSEDPFEINIDILINVNDFNDTEINNYVSDNYQARYPDYLDFDYLDNSEWVSYTAFFEDAYIVFHEYCRIGIATGTSHSKDLKNIKVVYFDDEGNILSESDIMTIEYAKWYETRTGRISFRTSTYTFDNNYNVRYDEFITLGIVLMFIIIFLMTTVSLIFSSAMRLFKGARIIASLYLSISYFILIFILSLTSKFDIPILGSINPFYQFITLLILSSVIHGITLGKNEDTTKLVIFYTTINFIFIFFGYYVLYY